MAKRSIVIFVAILLVELRNPYYFVAAHQEIQNSNHVPMISHQMPIAESRTKSIERKHQLSRFSSLPNLTEVFKRRLTSVDTSLTGPRADSGPSIQTVQLLRVLAAVEQVRKIVDNLQRSSKSELKNRNKLGQHKSRRFKRSQPLSVENPERLKPQSFAQSELLLANDWAEDVEPLAGINQRSSDVESTNSRSFFRSANRAVIGRLVKKTDWNTLFVKLAKVFLQYFLDLILNDVFGTTGTRRSFEGSSSDASRLLKNLLRFAKDLDEAK